MCKLNDLGKTIHLPELTKNDIGAVHRLPSKQNKTPGIIIRSAQQSVRDLWLEARKELRNSSSNALITESMTNQNRELLRHARDWAKNNDYKFSWHCNGKILIRRKEGDSAIHICCATDLDSLVTVCYALWPGIPSGFFCSVPFLFKCFLFLHLKLTCQTLTTFSMLMVSDT